MHAFSSGTRIRIERLGPDSSTPGKSELRDYYGEIPKVVTHESLAYGIPHVNHAVNSNPAITATVSIKLSAKIVV